MLSKGTETTVVAMASDEIYDWWLSFVSSFRKTNPKVRLLVIPYNDNVARIAELADVFDYQLMRDLNFALADELSGRLFGDLWHRHRLRKLLAFDLPLQDFLYIDVDALVYLDATDFMQKFRASGADIAFCTPSNDSVFTPEGIKHPKVRDSRRFSTGIFAARRERISFQTIVDCLEANSALYLELRHPTVVDQPIMNLCASLLGWQVKRFDEIDRRIAPVKWYKDQSLTFQDGVPRASGDRLVPVIHWAGNKDLASEDESIHLRRRFILAAQAEIGRKKPEVLRKVLPPRYGFRFNNQTIVSTSYGGNYAELFISSIVRHLRPRGGAFLEWGSGITSFLLADLCAAYGGSRFVTMDTYRPYQEAVLKALPPDVTVEGHSLDEKGPCVNQQDPELNYSMYPLSLGLGSCDLVFIDGRRRMECLMASLPLCHEETVILLHDYRRKRYQLALAFCDLVEDNDQFRVMRINRHILARMTESRDWLAKALQA